MKLDAPDQPALNLVDQAARTLDDQQFAAFVARSMDRVKDPEVKTALAVASTEGLPSEAKGELAKTLGVGWPQGEEHRYVLWMTVILVLAVLALAAGVGSYFLAKDDKDFAAFIGLATAAVGGLIGMFSTSPTTPRGNNSSG